MTSTEVLISPAHLELLAYTHPGADIELTADKAYLTIAGTVFVAMLPERRTVGAA